MTRLPLLAGPVAGTRVTLVGDPFGSPVFCGLRLQFDIGELAAELAFLERHAAIDLSLIHI